MKKTMMILAAAGILLTSCGTYVGDTDTAAPAAETQPSAQTQTEPATEYTCERPRDLSGYELYIDMSRYSENAKLLTAGDIYLDSFCCGYLSGDHPERLIIDSQEELDIALERYGLSLPPEDLNREQQWYYNTRIAEPFNRMAEEYPISDYTYVIEYDEVCSSGYDLHAGALLVDEKVLCFVNNEQSKWPDENDAVCDVMDGFCYMAAIPKGTLMNDSYEMWEHPHPAETEVNELPEDSSGIIEEGSYDGQAEG